MRNLRLLIIQLFAVATAVLAFSPSGSALVRSPGSLDPGTASLPRAIKNARVFTAVGAPITGANIVIRNGVIEDVGPNVTIPADALVVDGTNMNVYPGLIDMSSSAPLEAAAQPAAAGGGGRGGGGGAGQNTNTFATLEEAERAKREIILRPDYMAAENLVASNAELTQLASAGVTTVLAVPPNGIFKGQSALVNVSVPADDPQISAVADYRTGIGVVKSPVAMHINIGGRGGGQGYPAALLGTIAFAKQGLLDAQWQRDAEAFYARTGGRGERPMIEPALDALKPALAKQIPTALDAASGREIDRVLAIAAEFGLDPIVVGANEAIDRTKELAAAKARVIYSINFGRGGGAAGAGGAGGAGGGRGGGAGGQSLAQMKAAQNAPKTPAALAEAKVAFAFTSGGSTPADFVRNAVRAVKEGGLAADAALRALTIDAARIAGAADRTGSIEKGKIANIIVVDGDLFEGGRVRNVFIDGRPVEIVAEAPAAGAGRAGRGGGR